MKKEKLNFVKFIQFYHGQNLILRDCEKLGKHLLPYIFGKRVAESILICYVWRIE